MKRQYEHLDKLLEGSDPITGGGGNGNLYDELLGEGVTGYDDLLGSEFSGGVVENAIYHSVDSIIKEAMRKDISSEIMLREDFDPKEKLEKLNRLNSVTITNEHVMNYINDYIDPILEASDVEFIDGDSDGNIFPVHPMFMEMIDVLDDYENGPTQTASLEESVLGATARGDKTALKAKLHEICESYGISDTGNQKLLLKEALTIKENVHPSWYSVSIVGLIESEKASDSDEDDETDDVKDEDSVVESIIDNYGYDYIVEEYKEGKDNRSIKERIKHKLATAKSNRAKKRGQKKREREASGYKSVGDKIKDKFRDAKAKREQKKTQKKTQKEHNDALKKHNDALKKQKEAIERGRAKRAGVESDNKRKIPKGKAAGAAAGVAALGAAGAYAYKKYKNKKKQKEATNEAANFMLSHALCCSDETVMEQVLELANHWKSLVK